LLILIWRPNTSYHWEFDEHAPDHSSLTTFKDRIIKAAGIKGYEAIFNELLRIALEQGITFGSIQTIDSVHTIANVNLTKDKFRQEKKNKLPRDPDARWGVKKVKKIKQADGTVKDEKVSFYGYKTHVAANAENGLVTSLTVTGGETPDGKELPTLVNKDRKLGITREGEITRENGRLEVKGGAAYTADKAYDDGDLHEFTPFLVSGRFVVYATDAVVRSARLTTDDSNAPL